MTNLTIVVPVLNEEKTIVALLDEIQKTVKTRSEILIVYDFENDPTIAVARKYILKHSSKNISLIKNNTGNKKGVINAIKTALKIARGKTIVMISADLTDNLATIDQMYKKSEEDYDIVCASRYMQGGEKIGGPFFKTLLSKIAGLSLNFIFKFPIHDATNAFKIYRKEIFENIPIESTGGFEYSLEITIKAFRKGYKITEIPTRWIDRKTGKSNFKFWRWLPKYIKTYLLIINFDNKLVNIFSNYRKKVDLKWIKWANKIQKNVSSFQLIYMLIAGLLFSTFTYVVIVKMSHLKFSTPQTTAINWLTVNHYPKQQDYYLFFSLFGFVFFSSLIIWFIWINLKLKK